MLQETSRRIKVIDSHTGGEPTRIIIGGGPDLGRGSMAERREIFKRDYDALRSAVVNEPRGSDVMVGALLCETSDEKCVAGVIFFNNVGYLGMCGHGTIGLIVTLAHMGRIGVGVHHIETPVGIVAAHLEESGEVTITNVPSYRYAKDVAVDVKGHGRLRGDVAWGGNWFYLVGDHGMNLSMNNIEALTEFTWRIRQALAQQNVTGADGQEIDHIELFAAPKRDDVDSMNFVLCPGKAYDRSPCGTGTSAKLACLYSDGHLGEGQIWRQESIVGSVFAGSVQIRDEKIWPSIRGTAYVNAEAELILNERDPFCYGIRQ